MISVVADTFQVHPQTLRLYERLGLLKPSRSDGNTRLYTEADLHQLEIILNLTRERIRQVEVRGLVKIRTKNSEALGLSNP